MSVIEVINKNNIGIQGALSLNAYEIIDIDKPGRVVKVKGKTVSLRPREFELLVYLSENANIALSRNQILEAVWSYDYSGDARTVDTHIKRLRSKLGGMGDRIRTVRGIGYKFEFER